MKIQVSAIKEGVGTVDVRILMPDGSIKTVKAPAKGKVLEKDYVTSEEELDRLAEANANAPINPDYPEKAREIEKAIKKADRLRKEEQRTLSKYYDYNESGKLWSEIKKSKRNKRK